MYYSTCCWFCLQVSKHSKTEGHLETVLDVTDDPSQLHGVLTAAVGPRRFYDLPELTARYMRTAPAHRRRAEKRRDADHE